MGHLSEMVEPSGRELREFGFVMAGAFSGLFGVFFPWVLERSYPLWPWIIALVFLIFGLGAPGRLRLVYKMWMRMGHMIGKVMTPLILSVLFFGLITPFGLIRRVFGESAIERKFDYTADTYRSTSEQSDLENMQRPF